MVISTGASILDVAVAELRKRRSSDEVSSDPAQSQATLVFVGTRGGGKSTLVQKFLDREEKHQATLALEYMYGRRGGRALVKNVCHIWELGGGALFSSLLSTPINIRTIRSLAIVLLLDLSRPELLWGDLEKLLKDIKDKVNDVVDSEKGKQMNLRQILNDAAWERVGKDHQDRSHITPSLIPLVIMGSKYDLFQDSEPEVKRITCRTLRYVAHINGASLQFFSSRDQGLVKKAKVVIGHYGFASDDKLSSNTIDQDYNKPLIIPAGSDSLESISGTLDKDSSDMTLQGWKLKYTTKFPQVNQDQQVLGEDPGKDPSYAEPDVDNLRAHKDLNLERLQKELSRRSRYADVDLADMDGGR